MEVTKVLLYCTKAKPYLTKVVEWQRKTTPTSPRQKEETKKA